MGVRFDKLLNQSQSVLSKILAQKQKDGGNEPKFEPAKDAVRATGPMAKAAAARSANPTFAHEHTGSEATPLPKPMPLASGGDDDWSDDVFDQPTRVAPLMDLAKEGEPPEPRYFVNPEILEAMARTGDLAGDSAERLKKVIGDFKQHWQRSQEG